MIVWTDPTVNVAFVKPKIKRLCTPTTRILGKKNLLTVGVVRERSFFLRVIWPVFTVRTGKSARLAWDGNLKYGLKLPIVYNTGGYDRAETLKLLGGMIDIYMSDIKYSSSILALKHSLVENYWEVVKAAVKEMYRQDGPVSS